MKHILLTLMSLLLTACLSIPEGVEPVDDFELEPYMGRWYEIARLDHSFERGLSEVTAEYSLLEDGAVRVINSGTNIESGERKEAEGVARFAGDAGVGHLKVSFFGPFYASYVVFELDPQYQYAFVSGFNRDYLWLLAREPQVSDALKQQFITRAEALGVPLEELIWVAH